MQKVSKQSLAMLALSILLAISIALTFTFAALTDSKKATGTITFSGGGSVTWEGTGAADDGTYSFTLTEADFTINAAGTEATLNKTFADSEKVTFTNESGKIMYYRITYTYTDANNTISDVVTIANETLAAKTTENTTASVTLATLLPKDVVKLTSKSGQLNVSNAKIEFTAEFNFNAAYGA